MKRSDIQSELIRSFGQMDPSQGGTVIVWHDPEGEFEETLDELELPGIEVIREQENHAFELKCAMNEDLAGRSILLYRKRSRAQVGATMKRSDIQFELIRSFGQMDPSQGGAVIVWHDPEGEVEETLDELELPGIEVIREQENLAFELKCTMNEDLAGRSILLYRKRSRALEGDWLADIEMRAERFSADYASVQLREINAEDTPEMRALLAEHKALLSKKRTVKRLCALRTSYTDPKQVEAALIAAIVETDSLDPANILRTWLLGIEGEACEHLTETLEKNGLLETFATMIHAWTGFEGDITDEAELSQHILLSCAAPHLGETALSSLSARFNVNAALFCNDLY